MQLQSAYQITPLYNLSIYINNFTAAFKQRMAKMTIEALSIQTMHATRLPWSENHDDYYYYCNYYYHKYQYYYDDYFYYSIYDYDYYPSLLGTTTTSTTTTRQGL